MTIQSETRLIEAHGLGQGVGTGRLQPQQDADGLQNRRLPMGIRPGQKIQAGSRLENKFREAAKIAQPEIA